MSRRDYISCENCGHPAYYHEHPPKIVERHFGKCVFESCICKKFVWPQSVPEVPKAQAEQHEPAPRLWLVTESWIYDPLGIEELACVNSLEALAAVVRLIEADGKRHQLQIQQIHYAL